MPGRRVLLVDRDVDSLAALAADLRERGVKVALASGAQMACDRAKAASFDVVLATRASVEPADGGIGVIDAMSLELAEVPPLLVLHDGELASDAHVRKDDFARIFQRIGQLAKSDDTPRRTSLAPSAHALEHAPLGDLLVVLAAERRSGTVTLTTSRGSGEVRLVDGDVVDAVYVRLEGVKAIARMLGERDGVATFTPGAPAIMRRLSTPTRELVGMARALSDRAAALRAQASDLASSTLLAVEGSLPPGLSEVDQHVMVRLRVPATIDELLDELPHADASILEAVLGLHDSSRIRRIGNASARLQLCGPDQLHLVRASASRARAAGFVGPARLVFAASPARLAVFGHTVLSLADAFPSQDVLPVVPVPYVIATIRLGDGVDLEVAALPLVPAYAPLWPMALAGAASVVRLDEAAAEPLAEACACVGAPILDAKALFGEFDESSAVQIASLIKASLEAEGSPSTG